MPQRDPIFSVREAWARMLLPAISISTRNAPRAAIVETSANPNSANRMVAAVRSRSVPTNSARAAPQVAAPPIVPRMTAASRTSDRLRRLGELGGDPVCSFAFSLFETRRHQIDAVRHPSQARREHGQQVDETREQEDRAQRHLDDVDEGSERTFAPAPHSGVSLLPLYCSRLHPLGTF